MTCLKQCQEILLQIDVFAIMEVGMVGILKDKNFTVPAEGKKLD